MTDRRQPQGQGIFWGFLALVTLAELVTALGDARIGLLMHLALLLAALLYAGLARDEARRTLALALALAPLIRVLSLGMPLPRLPQLAWYPLVAAPLLLAAALVIRRTGLSRRELGFRRAHLAFELATVLSGFALGIVEYTILKPAPIVSGGLLPMALAALALTLSTGFPEELIFRGVLQTLALRVLGLPALLFGALLFGALHIGQLSAGEVVFVTAAGALLAGAAYGGVSLVALTLAHGLTNTVLFVLAPLYFRGELGAWGDTAAMTAYVAGGLGLVGVVLGVLIHTRRRGEEGDDLSTVPEASPGD